MAIVGPAFSGEGVGPGIHGWNTGAQYYDENVAAANAAGNQAYRSNQLRADTDKYLGGLQNQLARDQMAQQQQRFNTVYGGLQGLIGQSGAYGVGGQNTPTPTISAAPIYSPEQINAQVNSQRAGLLQGAQGQQQQLAAKMAGQGFGTRSPSLLAQQSNLMAQARGAAARGETDLRYQSAAGNAAQVLKGQMAQQQQWQDVNQADIERRKTATGLLGSLAGSLSGLI